MKKTKTVLILAAVTGVLLLGGCGSEKTKIYEQAGKDLSQGSYKYALEEYQSSIQNGVKLAQSYRGAGIASLRLGKYEDAVNSFTEALNCDKVSKSLRKDILSYRATAELKSGKYEDAMADCQTLGEDFSMDAGSYFLTGKVALAMDSYEEAASNFKQAYGEDSTYDMAIEIYEAYLDKDMEADGTRYLEAALSSEAKDAQDHCDRGRVYYYMEDYSNAKKELLEAKYEEGNEDFLRFVETFATGREDLQVEEIISRLYEFAGSYPDPEEWLDDCARMYEESGEKAIYIEKVMEYIRRTVEDMQMLMEKADQICMEPDGPYMYGEMMEADQKVLRKLFAAKSYEEMYEALKEKPAWKTLSRKKDDAVNPTKREQVRAYRDTWKKLIDDIRNNYFFQPPSEMEADRKICIPVIHELVSLVKEY